MESFFVLRIYNSTRTNWRQQTSVMERFDYEMSGDKE